MKKKALLLGASGLVGSFCLKYLLEDDSYSSIIVLSRKELNIKNDKLSVLITDFKNLNDLCKDIKVDDVFSCFGTTIKKAGSKEEFYKIDHNFVLNLAKILLVNGARQFLLVSSMGANSSSSIFYNKVKGDIENDLEKLNYESLKIFRPSVLIGDRKEKRLGEDIFKFISKYMPFLFVFSLKKYKGTKVNDLAFTMITKAKNHNIKKEIIFDFKKVKE
ncbi:MAG: NAD-dependent epimerase/dehydratase family protein [Campylobacteraceae bacterium]|nr:NAD-dependent epimerase/dehydratase family protein [Campylobacteraceae bacterium]